MSAALPWPPPGSGREIEVIDAHTAGEPLRIILSGYPELPGATILAKRRAARENHDRLRRVLMGEPRGHADMYGCILTPPVEADGDVGVLFLHNEGYSTMCGHGIIGLVKVGLELRLFRPRDPHCIEIDTPAGRVRSRAEFEGERVTSVSFRNVPSFLARRDVEIEVPGLGSVRCDLAYGGAFYAFVNADDLGLDLEPGHFSRIVDLGRRIRRQFELEVDFRHPAGDDDLNFLYGTIFFGPPRSGGDERNVCVFADGQVDRSPTGTGVSARSALLHARGQLALGEPRRFESLVGTTFDVTLLEETRIDTQLAVVPRVSGAAHITGRTTFWIGEDDPLQDGLVLR